MLRLWFPRAGLLLPLVLSACQSGSPSTQPQATASLSAVPAQGSTAVASAQVTVPAPPAPTGEVEPAASAGAAPGHQFFGDAIQASSQTPLGQVIAEPTRFAEQTVLVEGLVRRACTRRGCWMELATDEKGPACRVTFKDYGFFVPLDSAGSRARVQAVVKRTTVSAPKVRHHESEGAVFNEKNADGSANETRLIASGVELWR